MSSIEISFHNPWLLLLLLPGLAVILLPFLLLPGRRRRSFRKIAPVILHLLLVTLLVLIAAGVSLVKISDEQAVVLLLDLSDSTENVRSELLSRAEELLEEIDERTPVGVVVFGYDRLCTVKLSDENRSLSVEEVSSDATDIESALDYALTLLPGDRSGHLILLTDGRETDGNAETAAQYLASRGVLLDAVYFDTSGSAGTEMQISALTAPEGAYVGDEISFEAEIDSSADGEAVLCLYDNETPVAEETISVQAGTNRCTLTASVQSAGTHLFRLELSAEDDTLRENNEFYACVDAAGEPAVLIIADTLGHAEALAGVLAAENSVTVVTAANAPDTIIGLCDYDEVILSNVDYELLPDGYDELLEAYVGTYGRGLLVAGGTDTLMYGNMGGTLLEELLPVTFSLSGESDGNSVALMLVLDCSMSMSQNSSYLTVAKQGAIKCVEAMTDNDYVGVVSFNRSACLESGLTEANDSNRASLTRIISGLTTSQGTYYTEALELARQELEKSDAAVKHIIFLSDGQPSDRDYLEAVQNAAAAGISVSTIGLGFSSDILESMAEQGGGRYYYVSSAKDLPDIMLSETEQVTVSSLIVGEVTPLISTESEITDFIGEEGLPVLGGYLGTTLKEDAAACIVTEEGHPICAFRTYGSGTAACFTSDLNGNWSAEWLAGETGRTVILNMADAAAGELHHDSSLSVHAETGGKTADITVRTADAEAGNTVSLTVSHGDRELTYSLTQTEAGVFEGSIDTGGTGLYEMMILETDAEGNAADYLEAAFTVSYSEEYDAFTESSENDLRALCADTGGGLYSDMEKLAEAEPAPTELSMDPLVPLSVISLLIMLFDIAIRKLRWKDIRNSLFRGRLQGTGLFRS